MSTESCNGLIDGRAASTPRHAVQVDQGSCAANSTGKAMSEQARLKTVQSWRPNVSAYPRCVTRTTQACQHAQHRPPRSGIATIAGVDPKDQLMNGIAGLEQRASARHAWVLACALDYGWPAAAAKVCW